MEDCVQYDDEQPVEITVINNTNDIDPFGPEMVAISTDSYGGKRPDGNFATLTDTFGLPSNLRGEIPAETATLNEEDPVDGLLPEDLISKNLTGNLENYPEPNLWDNWQALARSKNVVADAANSLQPMLAMSMSDQERTKVTTELIINCIKQQSALWDSSSPMYGDSKYCSLLWHNIASVCGFNVRKLKAKWHVLKKTYKKEFIKSAMTGISSKSPNFGAMSFLKKQVQAELKQEAEQKKQGTFSCQQGDDYAVDQNHDGDGEDEGFQEIVIAETKGNVTLPPMRDEGIPPTPDGIPKKPPPEFGSGTHTLADLNGARVLTTNNTPEPTPAPGRSSGNSRDPSGAVKVGSVKDLNGNIGLAKRNKRKAAINLKQSSQQVGSIITSPGMPTELPIPEDLMPKRAKKSTIHGNKDTMNKPQDCIELQLASSSSSSRKPMTTEPASTWQIENPRTIERTNDKAQQDSSGQTIIKTSKSGSQPTGSKRIEVPTAEDDEVQIIAEVSINNLKDCNFSKKRLLDQEQSVPQKKLQTSEDPEPAVEPTTPCTINPASQKDVPVRKVDKDREELSNKHFLLSLLYDVESLSKKQFREFKKQSTALVSMILDHR